MKKAIAIVLLWLQPPLEFFTRPCLQRDTNALLTRPRLQRGCRNRAFATHLRKYEWKCV
jgi:hypothetical protein